MLGKIFITFMVIIAAIVVLKQRQQSSETDKDGSSSVDRQASKESSVDKSRDLPSTSEFRLAAYMFLTLMFGAAAILYYQRWQDDHSIVTVQLFRDGETAAVSYEVFKYQLDVRSFTTVNGRQITVADSERMEVLGLD